MRLLTKLRSLLGVFHDIDLDKVLNDWYIILKQLDYSLSISMRDS